MDRQNNNILFCIAFFFNGIGFWAEYMLNFAIVIVK